MSKEFFDDNFESSDADNSWLDEWNAEQKINPVDAHEMLRRSFAERLAEWKRNHPDENSWVIPFHYTHEDNDDVFDTKGALWIPPEHIQNVINRSAAIHMSAMVQMEHELYGTGIQVNHQRPVIMDLSEEVPSIYVDPRLSSMVLRHRLSIERDFGVIIYTR